MWSDEGEGCGISRIGQRDQRKCKIEDKEEDVQEAGWGCMRAEGETDEWRVEESAVSDSITHHLEVVQLLVGFFLVQQHLL